MFRETGSLRVRIPRLFDKFAMSMLNRIAGFLNRLTSQLLGLEITYPVMHKWIVFCRDILIVLVLSVSLVGVTLLSVAYVRSRRSLKESLSLRADIVARTIGRAALMPVSLADTPSLRRAVFLYAGDPDISYIRITDEENRLIWQAAWKALDPSGLVQRTVPIVSVSHGTAPHERLLGHVHVGMSPKRVKRILLLDALSVIGVGVALMGVVLTAAVIIIRQMTHRMISMVDELRLAEKLRQSNEDLQQFASIASHDLQEPLRTISGFLTLFEKRYKGQLDKTADEFIYFTISAANRMREMIQGLLQFSRLKTRANPFSKISLDQIVDVVQGILRAAIEESGARITRDPLPSVWGEETQLVQLLQNLVSNGIKFHAAAAAPLIHISAQKQGKEWIISVRDNGIGIDPKYLGRIFSIFQRLHTQKEYPGTGIGLALCRRIVENHGGRIWAQSEPGKGSVFLFSMPCLETIGK